VQLKFKLKMHCFSILIILFVINLLACITLQNSANYHVTYIMKIRDESRWTPYRLVEGNVYKILYSITI